MTSTQKELIAVYSDTYKEAHGFRPSLVDIVNLSEDELLELIDQLHADIYRDPGIHYTREEDSWRDYIDAHGGRPPRDESMFPEVRTYVKSVVKEVLRDKKTSDDT